MAQLPACDSSKIIMSTSDDTKIDKDGFVTNKKTISFENEGNDCLYLIHNAFSTVSDIPIIFLNFYDNNGSNLTQYVVNIDNQGLGLLFQEELYGGKVYKIYVEMKLQNSIKFSNGDFCNRLLLQTSSEYDKSTVTITIEKQDPWFDINIIEVNPFPTNVLNSNTMVWEIDKSNTRTVKEIDVIYNYVPNWNNIDLTLVGIFGPIILGVIWKLIKGGNKRKKKKNKQH
jgi:hypothetical protein